MPVPFVTQVLANGLGRATEDDGYPLGRPALAITATWGVSQPVQNFSLRVSPSLSVKLFQINYFFTKGKSNQPTPKKINTSFSELSWCAVETDFGK